MIYQISAQITAVNTLVSSERRAVIIGDSLRDSFYVVNAGTSLTPYVMKLASFGPDSCLRIIEARAVPMLAAGLREGLFVSQRGEPAFIAEMRVWPEMSYNLFLTKFNEWQPADAIIYPNNGWRISPYLTRFQACYDSYKIKSDYVGKQIGFRVDLKVESSGGLL